MKPDKLKKKTSPELQDLLIEKRKKLEDLRFDLAAGKLKNIKGIREIKKDIARILTFLREQEIKEKQRKLKK
jgi:large subunit ribosomal protein L29